MTTVILVCTLIDGPLVSTNELRSMRIGPHQWAPAVMGRMLVDGKPHEVGLPLQVLEVSTPEELKALRADAIRSINETFDKYEAAHGGAKPGS
jgi:hypothetical protein